MSAADWMMRHWFITWFVASCIIAFMIAHWPQPDRGTGWKVCAYSRVYTVNFKGSHMGQPLKSARSLRYIFEENEAGARRIHWLDTVSGESGLVENVRDMKADNYINPKLITMWLTGRSHAIISNAECGRWCTIYTYDESEWYYTKFVNEFVYGVNLLDGSRDKVKDPYRGTLEG